MSISTSKWYITSKMSEFIESLTWIVQGPDLSYCFTYLPFFIALGVAITCYFLLKTYFKTYGCSDKVRVLQSKLTTGLLLQVVSMNLSKHFLSTLFP
ncbi:unnamed protein product [Heligmosomoides polygyrus]|uniref:7TM_GPCR_Srx domain-containing protein n=1 Tax=Heligmosomoides polygyrus TaxID=6339 RepID=A0A183FB66_HELPZ|nr:unnamed protein product [Heligmosomoides polygyrus]